MTMRMRTLMFTLEIKIKFIDYHGGFKLGLERMAAGGWVLLVVGFY